MFPSPSLGAPLLSVSWSPPLFWGIPLAGGGDGGDVVVGAGVVAGVLVVGVGGRGAGRGAGTLDVVALAGAGFVAAGVVGASVGGAGIAGRRAGDRTVNVTTAVARAPLSKLIWR
jgi:hypothetical protein